MNKRNASLLFRTKQHKTILILQNSNSTPEERVLIGIHWPEEEAEEDDEDEDEDEEDNINGDYNDDDSDEEEAK